MYTYYYNKTKVNIFFYKTYHFRTNCWNLWQINMLTTTNIGYHRLIFNMADTVLLSVSTYNTRDSKGLNKYTTKITTYVK